MPPAHVPFLWGEAEKHIERALSRVKSKRYLANDVLRMLTEETAKLWIAWNVEQKRVDAAVVTRIIAHPRERDLFIWLVGGTNLKAWAKDGLEMVEAFAKAEGCDYVTGALRRGWLRVGSGYEETGITMEKRL